MPMSLRFQLVGAGSQSSKTIEDPATGETVAFTRQKPTAICAGGCGGAPGGPAGGVNNPGATGVADWITVFGSASDVRLAHDVCASAAPGWSRAAAARNARTE